MILKASQALKILKAASVDHSTIFFMLFEILLAFSRFKIVQKSPKVRRKKAENERWFYRSRSCSCLILLSHVFSSLFNSRVLSGRRSSLSYGIRDI